MAEVSGGVGIDKARAGATTEESTLIVLWAVLCAAAVITYALLAGLGWSALQLAVAALLALDTGGGVVANASNSAKRWFHRPGQGFREHFGFVLVHVHPFALAHLLPEKAYRLYREEV